MKESGLKVIAAAVLVPALLFYLAFSWGYVATVFSAWFVIPVFPEFPVLTWIQYAGIMFFASTIIRSHPTHIKEEYKDKSSMISYSFLHPWISLGCAWVFKVFFM